MHHVKMESSEVARRINECWEWAGAISEQGYARYSNGYQFRMHKILYESFTNKQMPIGYCTDHVCRNRKCVNPFHLEMVTYVENVMRGKGLTAINKKKTHCKYGHEFNQQNTYLDSNGSRHCYTCIGQSNVTFKKNWDKKSCVDCRKPLAKNSRRHCEKHLKYHRDYARNRKQVVKKKMNIIDTRPFHPSGDRYRMGSGG